MYHVLPSRGELGEQRGNVQQTESNMEYPESVKVELTNMFKAKYSGTLEFEGDLILALREQNSPMYLAYESVDEFKNHFTDVVKMGDIVM